MSGASRRAFLALGSNLGDRWAYLRGGLAVLPDLVAVSPVYQTGPVGGPPGQGPYLNLVAELRTAVSPRALLAVAQTAEAGAGRTRQERWGRVPLTWTSCSWATSSSTRPTCKCLIPRMWERGFVLVPLADLAPEMVAGRVSDAMRAGAVWAGTISAE